MANCRHVLVKDFLATEVIISSDMKYKENKKMYNH